MLTFSKETMKRRRLRLKLTIDEVAALSGVSARSIKRYEDGPTTPSAEALASLARVYGKPESAFIKEV